MAAGFVPQALPELTATDIRQRFQVHRNDALRETFLTWSVIATSSVR